MSIHSSFNKLSRVVQVILLLLPVVNWFTEVLVRGSAALHGKALAQIVFLILCILPTGIIIGWIDLICVILTKHLFLA